MNPKAANTTKPAASTVTPKDKEAARQCLMRADKFLKDADFENARQEVAKAQKLDPANAYAYAFLDRIAYFEEQRKKSATPPPETPKPEVATTEETHKPETPKPVPSTPVVPKTTPAPSTAQTVKPVPSPRTEPPKVTPVPPLNKPTAPPTVKKQEPSVERQPAEEKSIPQSREHAPLKESQPASPQISVPRQKPETVVEATRPVIAEVLAARKSAPESPKASPPGIAELLQEVSKDAQQHAPRNDIEAKLEEMRRQIEMLTNALEQERRVREEMNQQKLKGAVNQFRAALESAWKNGAPKDAENDRLKRMGLDLGIPEDVVHTVIREVKLDMYSKAVKEVVAKQKLIRNSSRTLEWLRNVYQVSLDEYLEYESKFLMDLVADQYKGTILLVAADEKISTETGQKLKSMGYAVVTAMSPENALEKIEKINPHFILCDMEFPAGHLSGIKFLHVLRANSKFNYTPFILMCSAGDITQLESSELRPTEGYVEKPFDIDTLGAEMNKKLMAFRQYLSSI